MSAFHGAPPVRTITRLLMFRDKVPHRMRFWSVVMFAFFYQLTGGVYLASISQMQGELAFYTEDVTMASYCSLIGLNLIFPVLFRWKFYFYCRQMFFVAASVSLVCAILASYTSNPWLFSLICFIAGYFKMMGMFCCISTIQLNMTPTRRFGVFLPVVYLLVLGALRVSDTITTWLAYTGNWAMIYGIIVVLMVTIDVMVYFMMKPDARSGPFIPLKGVDWIGQLLWGATLIAGAYIFNYGTLYEWWESEQIWTATWIFIVLLGITMAHMFIKKEPYIKADVFKIPIVWWLIGLLLGVTIIHGAVHYLQPIFVNGVLGYDSLNAIDLNYPQLCGIIAGAILSYFLIVRLHWSLRRFFFTAMSMYTIYAITLYFIVSPNVSKEILYVPLFFEAIGEIMIETGATYALSQYVSFQFFFMSVTAIGIARCGLGSAMGASLIEHVFDVKIHQYGIVSALQETYGIAVWVGVVMLLIIAISRYHKVPRKLWPKWGTIIRELRKQNK